MKRLSISLAVALWAAAPALARHHPPVAIGNWHDAVTDDDRDRLRRWRVAFVQALAQADPDHHREIAAEGPLLQPDAAQDDPVPPDGAYRCRTIKLGAKRRDLPTWLAHPPVACRISRDAAGVIGFAVLDGPQRPTGQLFADSNLRMIFLGTMLLGDETTALGYGRDKERDLIGAWERIGPARWRLVMPFPQWQSTLDVIEVTPAG